MSNQPKLIQRYTLEERYNHWAVAILFVLLALSGLAFFHPSLYWLSNLFGGGTWARILHPFMGVLLAVSFALLARRFWHHNQMTDADHEWLRRMDEMLDNHEEALVDVGRYNGGQKKVFWVLVGSIVVLALSGLLIWREYFAGLFPIAIVRLGLLAHSAAAVLAIAALIVHVYAAIWVKGTIRAMTRGTVTAGWAKKHHPAWYREVTSKAE